MSHEQHKWWSSNLGQDMELRVYGHSGKPVLVFPCQEGRFFDYEDFGLVDSCRPWLEAGKIRLFTVDSVDAQSWCNQNIHPHDRARRHEAYDRYLSEEVVPFIQTYGTGQICVTGCSMGGYHSANYFFRHPDQCDSVIALSGLYRLIHFIGDYMDEAVYYQTPLSYLPGLTDPWYLERYRKSQIFVCVGQGAWEEEMLEDTLALKHILEEKEVPAMIDVWGHDVNHDWPWWQKMMPYFLEKLKL
jgi:esterase/lipase superfamily enzyme